jgi:hypothetical protein
MQRSGDGCGFAAFLAESLWLSVALPDNERLRLGWLSRLEFNYSMPESQRLSAKEAAKP